MPDPAKGSRTSSPEFADSSSRYIDLELWSLDTQAFGRFVARVPTPSQGPADISRFGGWRAYLRSLN